MRDALRHCMDRIRTIRKPDPVEIVKVGMPVLCEAVAVSLFIAFWMVVLIIRATPIPDVLQ
ncbi:hypothetical protein [Bradyrhizobium sp. Arg816]|uniref:hypothetical protein n=1 Tax=Bradyrhizobium sp. Arg816 TaxID=2998491 RepID=UPI00249E7E1D|nr:hypothetical protein [Bradyrhizobium sp. Arg816]MDI3563530.1 hypothetical protein [Bradyrhizobium sp. Arg816]